MPIGDSFDPNVPVVGASGTQYAVDINEVLTELISRVSSTVPFSALSGTTFDLNNIPILDVQYLQLYEQPSTPTTGVTGRLVKYLNNLYWVHPSGVLQMTNGTSLNASGIGGIGGDYGGADPASVRFVAASNRYEFYDDFGGLVWAFNRARGFDIAGGATSTNYCQLRYGGAISYTLTLPATLPAADRSILVINSSGQVEHNDSTNTVQNDIHLDAVTNAKIRHGNRVIVLAPHPGSTTAGAAFNAVGGITCAGTGDTFFSISGLQTNWRLKSVVFRLNKSSAGVTTINVFRRTHSTGVSDSLGSNTNSTSGITTLSITFGTPETVGTDEHFYVQWTNPAASDTIQTYELTYDIV